MINFSISIGLPTAMVLLAFDEWRAAGYPDKSDSDKTPFGDRNLTNHFVASSKKLVREGYLTHQEKGHIWRITEKGQALCTLIRIEMAEVNRVIKPIKNIQTKQIK